MLLLSVGLTCGVMRSNDGTFTSVNFTNAGRRDSTGVEVMIKREISEHAFGWLSYTYSRSRMRSPGQPWTRTSFDQPHVLNAVASWKPGRGFELGVRYQLASGRPDTPVIGSIYNADTGNYEPILGARRSVRTPTFQQIDARMEKMWLYNTWSLGLYVDVINILNAENVEATQWDYRYNESAPVTSFPIWPTLGVRGTW